MLGASLFLLGVVNQRPVQASGVALLLVEHRPVSDQVAEGVVHRGSEPQCGHQACGGVGRHEGQSPTMCRVGQPQGTEAQRGPQRVPPRFSPKVRSVGLQRREGGPVTEGHGPRKHRPGGRRSAGSGGWRRLLEHPLGRPGVFRARFGGGPARVEDLLNGLHDVPAAALQHQLQDAPLVAGEDPRQDVDRGHVAGRWRRRRGRVRFVFVGVRARVGAQGADGARGVLPSASFAATASVLQRFGHRGAQERLAVSVFRAGASVTTLRGGEARGRARGRVVSLCRGGFARSLLRGAGPGQLGLWEQLVLLDTGICGTGPGAGQ